MAYQGRQNNGKGKYGPIKGKGIMIFLNEDTLKFVSDALQDISGFYTDERHEKNPGQVIELLLQPSGVGDGPAMDWRIEDDDMGKKAICSIPYNTSGAGLSDSQGELRVTCLLSKRTGDLNIDVRIWGPYTYGN
jgi:hypothetical protein